MAAKNKKWSPLRAVALVGLALVAVVAACDADAPTAIDDALVEVLGSPEAADGEVTTEAAPSAIQIRQTLGDGQQPLIFVDGVEVTNEDGALFSSLDPDDIESIEVIKGAAAAELYGERGERGIIQIITKESDASSDPGPLSDAGNNARVRIVGNATTGYLIVPLPAG